MVRTKGRQWLWANNNDDTALSYKDKDKYNGKHYSKDTDKGKGKDKD